MIDDNTKLVSRDIFTKYWEILKRNYNDKTHNTTDADLYYSIFRKFKTKDFIKAIEQVMLHKKYFPRIDEIAEYLPKTKSKDKEPVPEWISTNNDIEPTTQQEQNEMENLLNEIIGG